MGEITSYFIPQALQPAYFVGNQRSAAKYFIYWFSLQEAAFYWVNFLFKVEGQEVIEKMLLISIGDLNNQEN